MNRTTSPASEPKAQVVAEEFVWPQFNPSSAYRRFIERLRLARLERGLSIADMSDEVGLTFRLAHEFETLTAPLPFEWLEVWCETVGVPFADYLTIYRADQREWDERQAQLEIEAETHAPTSVKGGSGIWQHLRSVAAHIAKRFASLFSTPKETPE